MVPWCMTCSCFGVSATSATRTSRRRRSRCRTCRSACEGDGLSCLTAGRRGRSLRALNFKTGSAQRPLAPRNGGGRHTAPLSPIIRRSFKCMDMDPIPHPRDKMAFGGEYGEDILRKAYWEFDMTISEIADQFGVARTTVVNNMDYYDIERRTRAGVADEDAPWRDEDTLRRLYVEEKMSQKAVADELGCSAPTIRKWLDEHDIDRREPDWHTDSSRQRRDLWVEAREGALDRDGRECQRCGSEDELVVHHVVPVSEGGDLYDPSNLETVCEECHFEEHYG